MRRLCALLIASLFSTGAYAKPAAFYISVDTGGYMVDYENRARIMSGAKLVIDGPCLSACTMYLNTQYNINVCFTESAMLGYHKPYMIGETGMPIVDGGAIANLLWQGSFYEPAPDGIKKLLDNVKVPSASEGDKPNDFAVLRARDLRGVINECASTWQTDYIFSNPTDIMVVGPN